MNKKLTKSNSVPIYFINLITNILSPMEKKESYHHILPHFQQPGQAYFITWCLKDAIPPKALQSYSQKLELLKYQIESLRSSGPANSDSRFFDTYTKVPIISNSESNSNVHKLASPNSSEIEKLKKEYDLVRRKYMKAYVDLLGAEQNPILNLS